MRKYWKKGLIALLAVTAAVIVAVFAAEYVTFEALKRNSDALADAARQHYGLAVLLLGTSFIAAAFFVPGALVLTVAAGYLFGALPGALYAILFSTIGSSLAFLSSRYLIGHWVQRQYADQLKRFNEEILQYGSHYLFALRITPVLPSFLINYLTGLTHMPLGRFVSATVLGISPGAFLYSLAGGRLSSLESPADILSQDMLVAFCLIALLALLPVLYGRLLRLRRNR